MYFVLYRSIKMILKLGWKSLDVLKSSSLGHLDVVWGLINQRPRKNREENSAILIREEMMAIL